MVFLRIWAYSCAQALVFQRSLGNVICSGTEHHHTFELHVFTVRGRRQASQQQGSWHLDSHRSHAHTHAYPSIHLPVRSLSGSRDFFNLKWHSGMLRVL